MDFDPLVEHVPELITEGFGILAGPPGMVVPTITEWLGRHHGDDHPPLVILDTLGKARPQRHAGDDPYIADYQLGSRIKATVDALPGAALVAVHHTRKVAAEDWLDTISGTQGIAGSALPVFDHWFWVHLAVRRRDRNAGASHLVAGSVDRIGDVETVRRSHRTGQFNAGTIAEAHAAIVEASRLDLAHHQYG